MNPFRASTSDLAERGISAIRTLFFCLTAILILEPTAPLYARPTFSISGKVKTVRGHGFPMAVVQVDNGMGMTVSVFSKPNGRFIIKGLKPGRYEVSAEQVGYPKVSQTILIPGAKSVSLVLRQGPREQKPGKDQVHEAMNAGSDSLY